MDGGAFVAAFDGQFNYQALIDNSFKHRYLIVPWVFLNLYDRYEHAEDSGLAAAYLRCILFNGFSFNVPVSITKQFQEIPHDNSEVVIVVTRYFVIS